jgi:signal peptidase
MQSRRGGSRGSDRRSRQPDTRGNSFLDDFLSSVLAVIGIGLLLFAISGVWPPLVAIKSPSMEPNIMTGDLVFVMEEHRFASDYQIRETGVATAQGTVDTEYEKFNLPGDVIVYERDGDPDEVPVIHRAAFWVNKSEDWSDKAQGRFLADTSSCSQMTLCPAPNDGFVTLGDNNGKYDQVGPDPISRPVKPEWVIGTAEFNVPSIGFLRLRAGSTAPVGSVDAAEVAAG